MLASLEAMGTALSGRSRTSDHTGCTHTGVCGVKPVIRRIRRPPPWMTAAIRKAAAGAMWWLCPLHERSMPMRPGDQPDSGTTGPDEESASTEDVRNIIKRIDAIAQAGAEAVYVEILAKPGVRVRHPKEARHHPPNR